MSRALPVALLVAGCAPEAPAPRADETVAIGERCLDCHADIVRSYRTTGMARAVSPVEPGGLEGLDEVPDADTGWSYRLESGAAGPRIVERKGSTTTIEAPLAFAIGAGLMDRSYAARVGELLWFAPLEVVGSGEARHAALAPGHSMKPGTRFEIPIAEECLACHTDELPPRGYPLNLAGPSGWRPNGISCAACHGDVEDHARWRERDLAGEKIEGRDPVTTASRAGPIESLSLCARCHLQGDASFLLEPGARGIPPPGGDLLLRRAVFVSARPTDEIGFVSQVERLVLSRCFTGSIDAEKPLTCVTCHDPHRSVADPAGRAAARPAVRPAVRAGCTGCHASGNGCSLPAERRGGSDCAACHMRRTPVFDVAGVLIHDHRIERSPGPPSRITALRVKESADCDLAHFAWPGRTPAGAGDPGLRMMALAACGRRDRALPLANAVPLVTSARLPTFHHLRGSLLEEAGDFAAAREAYERALALDPSQAESAVNLGAVLGRLEQGREGIAILDAVLREHPAAEGALRNRGLLKLARGDLDGFAADLEAAFRILPRASVARALSQAHARAGRAAEAERWSRAAGALDPD